MNAITKKFIAFAITASAVVAFAFSPAIVFAYDDYGWGTSYSDSSWDSGWSSSYSGSSWDSGWGTSYGDSSWDSGWSSGYGDSDWGSSWGTSYGDSDWGSNWGTSYGDSDWGSSWGTSYGDSDWGSNWGTSYGDSDWGTDWGTSYGDSDWGTDWGTSYGDSDWSTNWGTSYGDSDWGTDWGTSYADSTWGTDWGTSYADSDWSTNWGTSYGDSDWGTEWGTSYADSDWGNSDSDAWGFSQDDWGYSSTPSGWGVSYNNGGSFGNGISWGVSWGDSDSGGCYGSSDCYVATCSGSSCDDVEVQCEVSDTTIDEGDCVTYRLEVDGGDSPFDYDWSGDTEGEGGDHQSIEVCYDDEGSYRVSGRVEDDDNNSDTDTCPTVVVDGCSGSSCDDNDEDIEVQCEVSDTTIEEGDCVTYTLDVDGGDSPFDYDWSGDTEGEGGDHQSIEVCYDDEGSYHVSGRVSDDDNDTDSDSCPTVVVDGCSGSSCNDDFEVQCEVSDDTIEEGDSVTFSVDVDGGDSPFTYDWSDDVDSSSQSFTATFNNSGTYTAEIEVTDDDGDIARDTCEIEVEDEDDGDEFDVECEVSDRTIDEGDCVTYEVNVDGGDSPFEYDWNGDIEGEDDDERTIRVCYDDEGDYEVTIMVEDDDGNRESDSCPSVEVDDDNNFSDNDDDDDDDDDFSGTLASIDAIYLSQIPYTGPEDILKLTGFGILIIGAGIGGAVALRKRSDRKAISERIAAFKAANLSKKIS